MNPFDRQLEILRRKIARIDSKYAAPAPAAPGARDLPTGREVVTELGRHWEIDRLWPAHHRHGSADVGALGEMPEDLLQILVAEEGLVAPPERWAFLDTETTGLAGGSGTAAFLVGVGAVTSRGFEIRQFFMRDHGEEPSMLHALSAHLESFDLMVTYNGKAFDQPLLETRYRLARLPEPFPRLRHVDLLFSARRLWKLALESCRLQELERRILGVERTGDVDGALIPGLYFEYLRTGDARPLAPVFSHNAIDVLSLACLTAIVPAAFREPQRLKHAAEMAGLARWLASQERLDEAATLMRLALKRRLDEALLYDTIWRLADLERRLDRYDAALSLWSELTTIANPWRAQAYERLAIHFEHREKNYGMALEMTISARSLSDSDALRKREERLRGKSAPRTPRLI